LDIKGAKPVTTNPVPVRASVLHIYTALHTRYFVAGIISDKRPCSFRLLSFTLPERSFTQVQEKEKEMGVSFSHRPVRQPIHEKLTVAYSLGTNLLCSRHLTWICEDKKGRDEQ
jgi:hypothetical protein